jgi:hypothetical protein
VRPIDTGTRRVGWGIAMGSVLATGTIALRGTVRPSMTAAFVAISRWAIAAGRTFAPHAARAFVGVIPWTVVAAITSPTATAFFTITIPIAITRRRAHFIAVVIPRTETVAMWWAVKTAISQAAIERGTGRMVWTRTIEAAPFGWTCKTIEAITLKLTSSWASKTFAFKLAATWTGEAITLEARTFEVRRESLALEASPFGTTPRAFTFETATFGRARKAVEPLTIEATALSWTIETIAVEAATLWTTSKFAAVRSTTIASAAIHGTGRPASLKSRVRRTSRSSTLEPRAAWTSRTTGPPHTLTDGLREFHELVFAQLAVVVFVEFGEEFGGIWRLWTTATCGAALACLITFAGFATAATAAVLAHLFVCLGALFVVDLAVFVRVEFFQHLLAPFSAAIVAFLGVLLCRLGEGRQGQHAGCKQCET